MLELDNTLDERSELNTAVFLNYWKHAAIRPKQAIFPHFGGSSKLRGTSTQHSSLEHTNPITAHTNGKLLLK